MGQLFSRLRIMQRIVLALLVPSLGLALAAAVIVIEKRTTVTDMQRLSSLAGLATHISGLVHDMQRERGASAVFIGIGPVPGGSPMALRILSIPVLFALALSTPAFSESYDEHLTVDKSHLKIVNLKIGRAHV